MLEPPFAVSALENPESKRNKPRQVSGAVQYQVKIATLYLQRRLPNGCRFKCPKGYLLAVH